MPSFLRRAVALGAVLVLAAAVLEAACRRRRPAPAPGTWRPLDG